MSKVESTKRHESTPLPEVQEGNQKWWTVHTMSYDWKDPIASDRFSADWFDQVDARFIEAARLFGHCIRPFDRIIPFQELEGKRVLEIGCGMGLHTELMVRAGAEVTAIDLSPTSIEATQARLRIRGLNARVFQCDAEKLDAPGGSFDFVWSWGAIHHSAHTGRIVRNVARMLMPRGEFRSMVYNRDGFIARYIFIRRYLFGGGFFTNSYDEILNETSDGFSARYYPPEQYADLLHTFFEDVRYEVMGQTADALPLPRRVRALVEPLVSEEWMRKRQRQRGAFVFAIAKTVI